jgi:hypothetical protein
VRAELAADHGGNFQKLHELAERDQTLSELLDKRRHELETTRAALTRLADVPRDITRK